MKIFPQTKIPSFISNIFSYKVNNVSKTFNPFQFSSNWGQMIAY